MSSALNPSPWYTRLSTYKRGQLELGDLIVALTCLFLRAHEGEIEELLGGPMSYLTIVPSTRGLPFEDQPFRRTLARVEWLKQRLVKTLDHRQGHAVDRRDYTPDAFRADPAAVGERIVLLEDTWVTGAKAISAAGALLAAGAVSVAVFPIARDVSASFWKEEHPYRQAMRLEHDYRTWPR
ncbi:MAG: hypothetical protein M3373_10700 [Gemmatimonadota bacterium]|nr:hypothetical protein [Gemmatimonadota bacterium]